MTASMNTTAKVTERKMSDIKSKSQIRRIAVQKPEALQALAAWALEAREALKFFGEPYTWSRVWADRNHDSIDTGLLDNMYGSMARAVLAKFPGEKR